jgi:hypothetical protein
LPNFRNEGEFLVEPDAILQRRLVNKGSKVALQWLIQWSNLPIDEATWEYAYEIKRKWPEFDP